MCMSIEARPAENGWLCEKILLVHCDHLTELWSLYITLCWHMLVSQKCLKAGAFPPLDVGHCLTVKTCLFLHGYCFIGRPRSNAVGIARKHWDSVTLVGEQGWSASNMSLLCWVCHSRYWHMWGITCVKGSVEDVNSHVGINCYLGRIRLILGKIVAQEMQLWHCVYCMKETWNTTIKSMSATLTVKKLLIM